MKTTLKTAALVVGSISLLAGYASAATSPVVGYNTTDIYGEFVSGPKTSLVAPSFVKSAIYTGAVAGVETSGANTIDLTGATFTAGQCDEIPAAGTLPAQPTYYVEILSDGFWANVTATVDGDTLTLEAGMASQFTLGDVVAVRGQVTLLDYLGNAANTPLVGGALDSGPADNIVLLDGGSTLTFFYETTNTFSSVYTDVSFTPADSVAIQPDAGLQIVRKSGGPTSFVYSGSVDDNQRQVPVNPGVNVRPVVLPVDVVLGDLASMAGSLNGIDGLTPVGGDLDTGPADEISVLIDGVSSTFFSNNTGIFPGTFINASLADSDAFAIPAGAAIVINRKTSPGFTWSIAAPTIAP